MATPTSPRLPAPSRVGAELAIDDLPSEAVLRGRRSVEPESLQVVAEEEEEGPDPVSHAHQQEDGRREAHLASAPNLQLEPPCGPLDGLN